MDTNLKDAIWQQFGAAIDMLGNALVACPEPLWSDRARRPEVWYTVYHTLFFLDFYLSDSPAEFSPPAPFTLAELDPAGVLPARPYRKDELLTYLAHGRRKCGEVIETMTEQTAARRRRFPWGEAGGVELLLYNLRHVQHHAAQINLILRQQTDAAPGWVAKAKGVGPDGAGA